MPNCESFGRLSHKEKVQLHAELWHFVTNYEQGFTVATLALNAAKECGAFEGVKFFDQAENELQVVEV
jgi:hypothetical protein